MVTWGANTVHTIAGSSPAPAVGFGAPAAAAGTTTGSGAFGAPTPATPSPFGTPAPAPGTGMFGAPAPASGGAAGTGLFGAPAPAPSGGLFGSSSSAASTGLFGAPSPASVAPSGSLFGTVAPSAGFGFGGFSQSGFASTPTQQQQQAPQIPAQAAMQAHLDASARQEEARVAQKLEHIQRSYTGAEEATDKSASFTTILYNPLTPEVLQQQWLQGLALDGHPRPVPLPRPAQLSEDDWGDALVRNPDFMQYMPIALVGAEALQARLNHQQELSDASQKNLDLIEETQETLRQRTLATQQQLERCRRRQDLLRKRMLDVMRKVEIARCFNMDFQEDEKAAMDQLVDLQQQTQRLRHTVQALTETFQLVPLPPSGAASSAVDETELEECNKHLLPLVQNHRAQLVGLNDMMQKDQRDLALIHERVEQIHVGRALTG